MKLEKRIVDGIEKEFFELAEEEIVEIENEEELINKKIDRQIESILNNEKLQNNTDNTDAYYNNLLKIRRGFEHK